ncbi:MAG: NeuD/PglB/VioB family sugar acetyltransferase, partial [Acidimicrobiia bacterium]|nr:NeuD/PglB/VioB family sugar acetyltransferase [Acidimicrobiia bacterium]
MQRLVIIGAGGLGREVLDVVEAVNAVDPTYDFVGFLDDGDVDDDALVRRGASVVGVVDDLPGLDAAYLLGVGSPAGKANLDAKTLAWGCSAPVLVHPDATIGGDVRLGEGTILTAGVRITTNVTAGRHVLLNLNATVGHDSTIGDHVTVAPGTYISGNVALADGVELGTGAAVLPGVTIGSRTMVGAGATVTRDLPAGVT